jgi:subtilase family serine protease
MQVDLRSSDYQKSHRFTVTVDPDNVIDEEDESNNLLRIRVSLPTRPQQYREVSCTLI